MLAMTLACLAIASPPIQPQSVTAGLVAAVSDPRHATYSLAVQSHRQRSPVVFLNGFPAWVVVQDRFVSPRMAEQLDHMPREIGSRD